MSRQTKMVQKAQKRLARAFGEYVAGNIYRSPAESGGHVGAATVVATGVSAWRRPATEDARQAKTVPVLRFPTNSGRIPYILKIDDISVDIREGDRWHEDGVIYNVEGVAVFHTAILCSITKPRLA